MNGMEASIHPFRYRHLHRSLFYSTTDAQVNCLKNNFKIYVKIDIKTAPTCFGAITIIRERIIRALKSYLLTYSMEQSPS
jgi:hypothetical protein